ncbi:MAG: hypothetical protein DMG46_07990 [Acidobacteria bacterium]|nr:MAG: hypothetical protein DMG46_07990 [Acidobacteriota bacterium]
MLFMLGWETGIEPNIRLTLPPVLEQHGFQVQVAATLSEALAAIRSHTFDVVLSDLEGAPHAGRNYAQQFTVDRLFREPSIQTCGT